MELFYFCVLSFLLSSLELTWGDRCDQCRRHPRSCQVVSREFTNSNLPMGYNYVNRIPAGVCNINITEYGPSSNYIALKTITGNNILNSQWAITPPGVYHITGTTFKYGRSRDKNCPGECVLALGPTNETIEFQLLTYHTNPGIAYQYQLPGVRWTEPRKHNGGRRHGDHRRKHHRRHPQRRPHHNVSTRYGAFGEAQSVTASFRPDIFYKHTRNTDRSARPVSHRTPVVHHSHKPTNISHLHKSGTLTGTARPIRTTRNKNRYIYENSRHTSIFDTSTAARSAPRSTSAPPRSYGVAHHGHKQRPSHRHRQVSHTPGYHRQQHSLGYQALTLSETSVGRGQSHYRGVKGHSEQSNFPSETPQRKSVPLSRQSGKLHTPQRDRNNRYHMGVEGGYNPYRENLHYGPLYPASDLPSGRDKPLYQPTATKNRQVSREYPQLQLRERPKYVSSYGGYQPYGQVQPLTNQQTGYERVGLSADVRPSYLTSNQALPINTHTGNTRGGQNQPYLPHSNSHVISPDFTDTDYSHSGELRTIRYSWRIRGFTNCSRECGGGVQETVIICVKGISEATVTEDNCDARIKPTPQQVQCNPKPCPPQWETGDWSECSVTCGSGLQRRRVECKKRVSADLQISISARRCSSLVKPSIVQQCRTAPCAQWKIETWGKCSVGCGKGERRRQVMCVDGNDTPIPESHCTDERPSTVETCHRGSCSRHWYYTEWSDSCSADCGAGVATRQVLCLSKTGGILKSKRCESHYKPKSQRSCDSHRVCGGQWFVGPWKKCSAACGKGVTRREVICMKSENDGPSQPVSADKCDQTDKPLTEKSCEGSECGVQWYMTDWSACSTTCGSGYQSREIKCLDKELEMSSDCDRSEKPETRKTCSQPACHVTEQTTDESCQDELTNCIVVAQARLCRYQFYRSVCCATCSKPHH